MDIERRIAAWLTKAEQSAAVQWVKEYPWQAGFIAVVAVIVVVSVV